MRSGICLRLPAVSGGTVARTRRMLFTEDDAEVGVVGVVVVVMQQGSGKVVV